MSAPLQPLHVVLGAGPAGQSVVAALEARSLAARIVRHQTVPGSANVQCMFGDMTDPAFLREATTGATVIYACAAPPYDRWHELFPPLQRAIIDAASKADARLVVLENLYMYGLPQSTPFTEQMPFAPVSRKGETRAKLAEVLLSAHREGRVRAASVRASDFVGPTVRDSALAASVFETVAKGRVARLLGDPDQPHSYTFVPVLGEAMVRVGEDIDSFGRPWHVPCLPAVASRALLERFALLSGRTARIERVPPWVLRGAGYFVPIARELREIAYQFEAPFISDHSAFDNRFGTEPTPIDEVMLAMADLRKVPGARDCSTFFRDPS